MQSEASDSSREMGRSMDKGRDLVQMNIDKLRIKRMRENAVPPSRKTDGAAGWDLAAAASMNGDGWSEGIKVVNHKTLVPLGWAFEIPPGYVGLLAPRSSRRHQFADGVIDSDY